MEYDLLIKNGTVVDGTRAPRIQADVGIKDGKICKIGQLADATATRTLDATDCVVAPGFVDLHTHYDAQIYWDPYCTISGWHGVTSVVIGNCGFGFAPVKGDPESRERAMRMLERVEQIPYAAMKSSMSWDWETFPQWLESLRRQPKGVNILSFVPVSPLMVYVMGMEAAKSRPATAVERIEMKRLLSEAMDAGAAGFSLQRLGKNSVQADIDGTPMPTDLMSDEDVLSLAEVLGERGEGFIQITQAFAGDIFHFTEEQRDLDHAFLERLAMVSQRPILHNAIAVMLDVPDYHKKELAWIHAANDRGCQIYGQGASLRFWVNFTLEDWNLYDSGPAWNRATQGTVAEKIQKMSDPAVRAQMRDEYEMLMSISPAAMPGGVSVTKTPGHPELEKYIGRNVGELATEAGIHPNDMMLDIAIAGDLKVEFRTSEAVSSDAEKVAPLMSDPLVLAGISDGGAHTKSLTGGSYTTDYLTWLVRDSGKITLEDAHHDLSYLPCQVAGLTDRGFLAEGAAADVVVYNLAELKRLPEWNYETVHDLPGDEWRRVQRAEGYRWTIVNGEITFENGECSGATPGQLLSPTSRPLEAGAAQGVGHKR